ncbi:MAG: sulfatase-like hydrolase/transferase [Candidatus Hydrogenedentes bacterium]|nr:sulfatase-like hydrolase/transferase [Candidatus Hydrogenedentota bacterium]
MNIVMMVIDTLRADHLGCYGYHRNTSPYIDDFAKDAVVCDTHLSPAIPTHPAFTTLNTGQFSITHGVVAHNGNSLIPRSSPWLPSLLHKNGYTTCAVDNLSQWQFDFHRGYEFYIDPTQRNALSLNADNRQINSRVLPWLEQHHKENFCLFVHYWDPHTPYMPPRAYRNLFYKGDPHDPKNTTLNGFERHPLGRIWRDTWFKQLGGSITDAAYIEALYDASIRYCDEGIGLLLETLDKLGHREDTLVLLLADHGEMMYRHGIFFDHHGLYEGNIHVPLMVRHPEFTPRHVNEMTAHVDVAPTILDMLGIDIPEAMEGESLVPWLTGATEKKLRDYIVCQECTWQMKWAVRTNTHKFILARQPDRYNTPMRELYDIRNDPDEQINIAEQDRAQAQKLESLLESWIHEHMSRTGQSEDPLIAHGLSLGK